MAPPSKLGVSTSALQRLIKEEASYHKELEQQEKRIQKLQANPDDENAEYMLKQERTGVQETKKVLPAVREKITKALQQLEEQLESNGGEASTEDVAKAKEAVAAGKKVLQESA